MTTNLYRELLGLLPQDPLLVGTVTTSHADGTVSLDLPGGGTLRVRGIAATGDRVFVRSGLIEGEAPALALLTLDV